MTDTIVAISTSSGIGAISIIRLSGPKSIFIANSIFKGKDLTSVATHTINYGHIYYENKIIDEVLVSVMRAPKTFTFEDVVEINCHGGIITTNRILEALLINGARLAEPGEFTKRAFLNGRIDLIEVEATMDIINSKSESACQLAINQLTGTVSNMIKNLRNEVFNLFAPIEVNIDYPEYTDLDEITIYKLRNKLNLIEKEVCNIIKSSEEGQIVKNGLNIAIIGKPNVGKSSILNCFLEEEKAIVTPIAGTTRDTVEGQVNLSGIIVNFIDTAGIHETNDVVEKIGVKKSLATIEKADLIIAVFNGNEKLSFEDEKVLSSLKEKKHIIVINKSDLTNVISENNFTSSNIVTINTLTNQGINPLKEKIKELFNIEEIKSKDLNYLSNARQIALLKEIPQILNDVKQGIENNIPIDMIEIDLKRIWEILGNLLGESYEEELLDKLFSNFCLGK